MKNIIHNWILILFSIFSLSTYAQRGGSKTIIDPAKPGSEVALSAQEFEESVLVIENLSDFASNKSLKKPITIELVNFNKDRKLLPAYRINDIEYSDNGKYNDKVAGDGIFTSVQSLGIKGSAASMKERGVVSDKFLYSNTLSSFRGAKYAPQQRGTGISCKIRLVTCAETAWYNSCWPLSSPCQCIQFYDCEVSIGFF